MESSQACAGASTTINSSVCVFYGAGDAEQVATALGSDLVFERPVVWLLGMERGKFVKERDSGECWER